MRLPLRWSRTAGASSALAPLAYLLLTLALTAPLLPQFADGVPHDASDPLLNAWLLRWNAQVLPFSAAWWNGPFFYPLPGVLSFSESLVGLAPLASPLSWAGLGPIATYNALFLLSFALSAWAMELLARALGLSRGAAFVAGLAFGFAPYRAGHLAHLQILSAYGIPFLFLGAHRYLQSGRWRWLLAFASAWGLLALTNGYYLVFVSVLLVGWLAWFVPAGGRWRRGTALALAWLVAALAVAPVLFGYRSWHARYGFQRSAGEIQELSADLLGLLSPAPALAHWPASRWANGESWLFPGLTVPLLLAWLLIAWRRREGPAQGRAASVAAGVAALAAAVAAVTAAVGPWRLGLGPLTLSVKALSKPLALAFYGLLLAVAASRSVRALRGRGSVAAFYLLAGCGLLLLALGPQARFDGVPVWDKAPYWLLLKLPGLDALRSPARFAMPAVFCLALAAASALDRLPPAGRRLRPGLVALAAAGIAWDGWLDPLHVEAAPVASRLLRQAEATAVLELPLGPERDPTAMVRSLDHGRPVWNGYSGYVPAHYHALALGIERREPGVLAALREQGTLLVLLDRSAVDADALERFVRDSSDAEWLGEEGRWAGFRLPGLRPSAAVARGAAIPARISRGADRRAVYELDRETEIAAVALRTDPWRLPRHVTLEAARGPGAWRTVFQGPVGGRAVRDGLREPRRFAVLLETPGAYGRLLRVRIVEGGFDELTVYAPAR